MSEQVGYYELLQVSPNAEPATIAACIVSWRSACIRATERRATSVNFRQLHNAFSMLSDPVKGAQFDIHPGSPLHPSPH
jgi:hypothetical protein